MAYSGTPEEKRAKSKKYYDDNHDIIIRKKAAYRAANPNAAKDYYRANKTIIAQKRVEFKQWFVDYKKTLKCQHCGMNDWICLQFHHLDPTQKDDLISTLATRKKKEVVMAEIAKCIVLCANCHTKEHYRLSLSTISVVD